MEFNKAEFWWMVVCFVSMISFCKFVAMIVKMHQF